MVHYSVDAACLTEGEAAVLQSLIHRAETTESTRSQANSIINMALKQLTASGRSLC